MNFVLIHGTFDTDDVLTGDRRWWQTDSEFYQKLHTRFGANTAIYQRPWSGENSQKARNAASVSLQEFLSATFGADDVVTIISHSHGGNVAQRAVRLGVRPRVRHLSVGTPFLNIISNALVFPRFFARYSPPMFIGFLALMLFNIFVLKSNQYAYALITSAFVLIGSILVVNVVVFRLAKFARSWRRRIRFEKQIAVSHPMDEVALLFESVDALKSVGVDTNQVRAVIYQVISTVTMIAIIVAMAVVTYLIYINTGSPIPSETAGAGFALSFELATNLQKMKDVLPAISAFGGIATVLWALLYTPIARVIDSVGGLFAPLFRKGLDATIVSTLKSAVFGRDDKFQLDSWSRHPDKNTALTDIPVNISEKLAAETSENLGKRIALIKSNLISSAIMTPDAAVDLLHNFEWNELVHTYYFRQSDFIEFALDLVEEVNE